VKVNSGENPKLPLKIGVISDTHGYLDPRVEKIFAGVDHILHAGDIGFSVLIVELEFIAPITAVLGNNDEGLPFKETEVVKLGGKKFSCTISSIHRRPMSDWPSGCSGKSRTRWFLVTRTSDWPRP